MVIVAFLVDVAICSHDVRIVALGCIVLISPVLSVVVLNLEMTQNYEYIRYKLQRMTTKKVQVGNDQEKAQSERNSRWEKLNQQFGTNTKKPFRKLSVSFERNIWLYDRGNYDLLREKASLLNWVELQDDDINIYAKNITDTIMDLSKQCIPNKSVRVKSSDPPWITSSVKKHIRARRRLYRKAKQTDDVEHWNSFRRHRNKTLSLIRKAKQLHIDKLKEKLTSNQLSSKDWWATLKHFISPSRSSSIPPLNINNVVVSDPTEKANLLNNYFRDQTILNDNDVEVPFCPPHDVISELNSLVLNPEEVLSILKSLPTGKAVGPDGVSNRILKELAEKIHIPLTRLFNHSLSKSCVPLDWKKSNVSPVPKSDDTSLPSNYRPISLLSNIDKVFVFLNTYIITCTLTIFLHPFSLASRRGTLQQTNLLFFIIPLVKL